MNRQQALKILAASSAAFALQGCVAAVIPIAAGGLMTQSSARSGSDGETQASAEREATEATSVANVPAQTEPVSSPEPAPEVQAAIAENVAAIEEASNTAEDEPTAIETGIEEAPAQTTTVLAEATPPDATAPRLTSDTGASQSESFSLEEPAAEEPVAEEPVAEEPVAVLVASLPENEPEIAPETGPEPTTADAAAEEPVNDQPAPVLVASLPEAQPEAPAELAVTNVDVETDESPIPASPSAEAEPLPSETVIAANTSAPAPRQVPFPAAPSSPGPVVATLFDPLVSYATSPEFEAGQEGRTSAMLSDATSLLPNRVDCGSGVPTVLIDLDPDGEDLALSENLSAPAALGVKLAQMRAQGIAVAWISRKSADAEESIRAALTRSGLDLSGRDRILLIGSPSDRKQTLRDGLAGTSCLVAIAGDTRSDFHELFGYLLNPSDASSLQPMIGNGWFIIPTPLLPERP